MELRFTAEQIARLRAALGLRPGDPAPTADDLVAVIEAQRITDDESRRWQGLTPPESQP